MDAAVPANDHDPRDREQPWPGLDRAADRPPAAHRPSAAHRPPAAHRPSAAHRPAAAQRPAGSPSPRARSRRRALRGLSGSRPALLAPSVIALVAALGAWALLVTKLRQP